MTNRTAIVTAASQGIGAECTRLLSQDHDLVIMSRSDKIFDLAVLTCKDQSLILTI